VFDFPIAGVQIQPFLLAFLGFTAGIVGGFLGVGGGYMVTPALIVFGFPGFMASGIDLTHITGSSIISTVRHRQLGNIDWAIALTMVAGTMFGTELGIRLLGYFKSIGLSTVAVLVASLVIMLSLFFYVTSETRQSHKRLERKAEEGKEVGREEVSAGLAYFFESIPLFPIVRCRTAGLVISMWIIAIVGMLTGVLSGFLGVGGGFIRVPALVYLVGASTHIAVGTDLAGIALSGGYGALRHSVEGNVDFVAVMFMLTGSVLGSQFGSFATAYVRGPAIRHILSYSLGLASLGALLPLLDKLTGSSIALLGRLAVTVTLGQMIFLCLFILSMLAFALLARRGYWVPAWVSPLVVRSPVAAAAVRPRLQPEA